MEFRSIVPISKNMNPIDYHSKIFFIGSCFAENIASKFDYYKFDILCNPFGIIFNSKSIVKIITRIVNLEYFDDADIFTNNGLWHCFEVHSVVSKKNKITYLEYLNDQLNAANQYLKNASNFIITLGTSWVYELKDSKKVVANCHKMPQSMFSKTLLTAESNAEALHNIIILIQKFNPKITTTITISPVRHFKDGFFENNVSKSNLFSAIYNIVKNSSVTYFPSYEILMDELRDYRFYSSDHLHPSEIAIEYIWERFKETQISEKVFSTINDILNIQKMLAHRHFNNQSVDFHKFKYKIDEKISKIREVYPNLKF